MKIILRNTLLAAACFSGITAQTAFTQTNTAFPNRALRLIVPFAPGGSTDTLARIVGQGLTASLGQAVVVDNRPAGGGIVGADLVAKSHPDGYTSLVGAISTMAIAPALYPKMPYHALNDFTHAGLWVTFPLAMIVPAGSPIRDLKGFVEQARAKPGALRFGTQGIGTSSHVFAEWMNSLAKIKVVIVPYKGGGPALTGILSGEVDYAMVAVSTALAQVQAGKIRALGVTSAQTTPHLPGVPSIASVVPGYDALNFHGLHLPVNTPTAIVTRLNVEIAKILKRADVADKLNGFAMDISAGSPEHYRSFIKAQLDQWAPVVKSSGMRAE